MACLYGQWGTADLTHGCLSAFKFLPVLGRYTADCFEGTAPADIRRKWRLREEGGESKDGDGSRGGPPLRILSKAEQAKL